MLGDILKKLHNAKTPFHSFESLSPLSGHIGNRLESAAAEGLAVALADFNEVLGSVLNEILHGFDKSPFIRFGRRGPLPGQVWAFGQSETEKVSSIHAAQVQSDGLANCLQKVLHAVHLLYLIWPGQWGHGWRVLY